MFTEQRFMTVMVIFPYTTSFCKKLAVNTLNIKNFTI